MTFVILKLIRQIVNDQLINSMSIEIVNNLLLIIKRKNK